VAFVLYLSQNFCIRHKNFKKLDPQRTGSFSKILDFIKLHKRWTWIIVVALVLGTSAYAYSSYNVNKSTINLITDTVGRHDIRQTVYSTGEVKSSTDLNLSFKTGGIIKTVSVKVGDKVKEGQILAQLELKDQNAALTSAKGALAQAQANYDKIVAGASNEQVAVAQAAVDAAKKSLQSTISQQQVGVANALSALNNSSLTAVPANSQAAGVIVTVSGTYTSSQQGTYTLTGQTSGSGVTLSYSGLESGNLNIQANVPIALGTRGLFIQFSTTINVSGNTWTIEIPNKQAQNYVTNLNTYNSALSTQNAAIGAAQSALDQANANLALQKAHAQPADVESARAQILIAQGQVESAQAGIDNGTIIAAADGTITKIDGQIGLLVVPQQEIMVLQNIEQLHLESNIPEANILNIKPGQNVEITFDAFGSQAHYTGKVTNLDISSTTISKEVNYKLKASLDNLTNIKPGLTADMTILIGEKNNVLGVPASAIIDENGKRYVGVVTNAKEKTYVKLPVTVGLYGNNGIVEITSGLSEGQTIVTYVGNK
jgi:HlyD family secretion protein